MKAEKTDRLFNIDNKKEVKLNIDGFDKAPILIGKEQSDGEMSFNNLSNFQGCNLSIKTVNIKNDNGDVIELKTYYTVAEAKEKKYNNEIIESIERSEDGKIFVEVCIGIENNKRYIILPYSSMLNMVDIVKTIPSEIHKMFIQKEDIIDGENGQSSEESKIKDYIELVLYDKDGFETKYDVKISEIANCILSVRIIGSATDKKKDSVSKKAQEAFKILKEDGKNKIEAISDFTSLIMKMLSFKKV